VNTKRLMKKCTWKGEIVAQKSHYESCNDEENIRFAQYYWEWLFFSYSEQLLILLKKFKCLTTLRYPVSTTLATYGSRDVLIAQRFIFLAY